ncbi:ubiquinol-cytochrome c reductase iron-sulfur subunit [Terracidiphilus sp.]|jgi:menaquinol-cytochrome c reductase iron-sulfur subunit|uniref:QcrA and Rieske domain-containing protein n=1 Tax=Terracidiphilus sp. TaxID=1964191 RepID=UPI003C29E326
MDEHPVAGAAEDLSRRTFLMKVGIALNAVVALAIATPVVAYILGPVIKRKEYLQWIPLGGVDDFAAGQTSLVSFQNPFSNAWDGATAQVPAYVRRTGTRSGASDFTVFAINCAHLGCPVRWFKESQLFMCPCHGGVYYADGSRASGPPERGLFTYEVKLDNGKLMIDAGQIPTLSNRASADGPCSGGNWPKEPAEKALANIVKTIEPYKPNPYESPRG